MRAFTQASGSWVEVTRAAVGVRSETRYSNGTERRCRLRFTEGSSLAALGFSLCVDALCVRFAPLDAQAVVHSSDWRMLRQHLVPTYMLNRMERDPRILARELSDFEIGWLWQLEISMLVAVAVTRGVSLEAAAEEVKRNRMGLASRTMDVIFQSQRTEEDDDEIGRTGRLREKLSVLISDPEIIQSLTTCSAVLWADPDAALTDWLQECYAASLGATLFDAVTRVVPDIDPDSLSMDVEGNIIWIAEQTPGGVGIIQRIAEAIARRPRDLDLQLLDTLRHCDRELLATQLSVVADLVSQGDAALADAFTTARGAVDRRSHTETLRALGTALEPHGISATRDLVIGLNSKFLRSGSSTDSDKLVAMLATRWQEEQLRLGCAIDLRVMAVAAWRLDDIRSQVESVFGRVSGAAGSTDENQAFNLLQSLLWLDCRDSCPDCIEPNYSYQRLVKPSRALLRSRIDPISDAITFGEPDWLSSVSERLAEQLSAQVLCNQIDVSSEHFHYLLVTPIEVGFQQYYPTIERIERREAMWLIGLVLRDLAQS